MIIISMKDKIYQVIEKLTIFFFSTEKKVKKKKNSWKNETEKKNKH